MTDNREKRPEATIDSYENYCKVVKNRTRKKCHCHVKPFNVGKREKEMLTNVFFFI